MLRYTEAVGKAGHAFLDECCKAIDERFALTEVQLPSTFTWSGLFERLVNAAVVSPEAEVHDEDGWEWAVVEVFGHRKHAGRTREEERFGAKLLRIDVPNKGDPATHGWTTHYYGGSSLFSFTPATREACLKANKPYEPPARYALTHNDDEDIP